ncbi:TylF/MycF/NovP-related O-methyltransferase [Natronoarchaeum rubrum]|uniref:TylF/MycF/NovP-related O-methyltransferase n=1 Tax=Natronoarchaeum rubrum TaxID=755311 RepID=UPI00211255B4|nr:TylF/MycF/NovP-related O-methyltransferase [Natronoarchaeum rubrum]
MRSRQSDTDSDATAGIHGPAEPDQPSSPDSGEPPASEPPGDAGRSTDPRADSAESESSGSDDAASDAVAAALRCYRLALLVASLPVILGEYFRPDNGAQYGVGVGDKLVLAAKMLRNNRAIPTGSSFVEHLVMATKVLSTPRDVEGAIVECGCYKGGSTANLSLVAGLCDRELVAFDCFEGMPEPGEADAEHLLVASERVHTYEENSWSASLREAVDNVEQYGDPSAVSIRPGYFEETMPTFDEPVALAFLDVGLRSSAETAVRELWPLLGDNCYLFTHEAKHMEIAALFFEGEWWREHVGADPPGLVGAGSGLGLHPTANGFSSLLAYARKNPDTAAFDTVAETGEDNTVDASVRKN